MKSMWLVIACVAGVLSGCNGDQDASYWQDHPAERDAKIQECRSVAASFDTDKVCIAAMAAESVKSVDEWKLVGDDERKFKSAECKSHAGTLGKFPNCTNVAQAVHSVLGAGKPIYIK